MMPYYFILVDLCLCPCAVGFVSGWLSFRPCGGVVFAFHGEMPEKGVAYEILTL
jgi:hypothetical protein